MKQMETLEGRRLLAQIGADVTWGRDGQAQLLYAGQQTAYIGRAGSGFYASSEVPDDTRTVKIGRYDAAGRLVSSFTVPDANGFTRFYLDPQGRLYGDGPVGYPRRLQRYDARGRVDPTFATRATVTDASGTPVAFARDGSAFLFGTVPSADGGDVRVIRKLKADGRPDTSFGSSGVATLPGASSFISGVFVGVDAQGRVLVASQTDSRFTVTRLRPDGTIDTTYGSGGSFARQASTGGANRVALDAGGRVLLVTFEKKGLNESVLRVLRVTARGRPDGSFGTRGMAAETTVNNGFFASVVVRPDGTILADMDGRVYTLDSAGRPVRGRGPAALVQTPYRNDGVVDVLRDGRPVTRLAAGLAALPPVAQGTSGRLYLNGDNGDDTFRLRRGSRDTQVYVDYNGRVAGVFDRVPSVIANLGGGDDTLLDRYLQSSRYLPFAVVGGAGDDRIETGAGRDVVDPGDGNDTVSLGGDDDNVNPSADDGGSDTYDLGEGNDSVFDDDGPSTVYAGPGNDRVTTGYDRDRVYGGPGDDFLRAGQGDDLVYGQDGGDTLYGDPGDDYLFGGYGDDEIDAGEGNDTVYGNDSDTPKIPSARNTLVGKAGRDTVYRESDDDDLSGFESVKA